MSIQIFIMLPVLAWCLINLSLIIMDKEGRDGELGLWSKNGGKGLDLG